MAVQYHEVTVGGQTLRVAHERGAEYIHTVATYVEHKLQARAQATKAPLTMRLAMMTALEIADELFTTRCSIRTPAEQRCTIARVNWKSKSPLPVGNRAQTRSLLSVYVSAMVSLAPGRSIG